MNKLIVTIFCFFATITYAADFQLNFKNPTQIEFNQDDWTLVSTNAVYDLFVEKSLIGNGTEHTEVYSLVVFKDPNGKQFNSVLEPVSRIFNIGLLDCANSFMMLLHDLYTNNEGHLLYVQNHEPGQYIIELQTVNTARNDLFRAVCKK